MKSVLKFLSVFLLAGVIAACSTTKPWEPQVNLIHKNHMAADNLVSGLGDGFDKETPIIVGTISDVSKVENSSPLGRTISEHIMSRLVESGFTNVSEIRLRQSLYMRESSDKAAGEFLLSRDARAITGVRQAGAVVTGTYTVSEGEVLVSTRITEMTTGTVLSSYDYRIPMNSNIEDMLHTDDLVGGGRDFFATSESMTAK